MEPPHSVAISDSVHIARLSADRDRLNPMTSVRRGKNRPRCKRRAGERDARVLKMPRGREGEGARAAAVPVGAKCERERRLNSGRGPQFLAAAITECDFLPWSAVKVGMEWQLERDRLRGLPAQASWH